MFTGLIDSVGTIERITPGAAGLDIRVACGYQDLVEGESVAINGACLTVRECTAGAFLVAATVTTLERTAIGSWQAGRRVNLERSLRLGDRLGGHLVQGHVDCVGQITALERLDDALVMSVAMPDDVWELMAARGSIAIDGVSLTVHSMAERGGVSVSLIEYTLAHTALGDLAAGDDVHVEADIIGKHVQRLLAQRIDLLR